MKEFHERLAEFCAARGIERFSPEEIIELLEDGEEVGWIVEQVAPDADASVKLTRLLTEIAAGDCTRFGSDRFKFRRGVLFSGRNGLLPDRDVAPETGTGGEAAAAGAAEESGAPAMASATAGHLQSRKSSRSRCPRGTSSCRKASTAGRSSSCSLRRRGRCWRISASSVRRRGYRLMRPRQWAGNAEGPIAELREEWLSTPRASLDGRSAWRPAPGRGDVRQGRDLPARGSENRPQRPLSVRQREEIQEMLRQGRIAGWN